MSGIAGVVHLDGAPVQPEQLEGMVQSISYRGPDGVDTYFDGPVALAQLWLRTTPESQDEKAPYRSSLGALVVGDVRLDNREELLGLLDLASRASSDTSIGDLELVGRAFDRWGSDAIPRLLGDFALAIWDGREHTLHLARDAFGIRPLCWARVGDTFVFSSQATGVLAHPSIPHAVDDQAIADQLMFRTLDPERTHFTHVRRLPPAHELSLAPRGVIRPRRYWHLPKEELRLGSDDEYAEMFKGLLLNSVRSRLRSTGEVAFDLSGGLDSSSIVGAGRILRGDDATVRTYSVSIGGDTDSDPEHRQAMVEYARTLHTGISGETVFERGAVREALGVQDGPYMQEGHLFQGAEYLAVVADGAHVLLSGIQGDTVVLHGYQRLVDLLLTGRWGRLIVELREYERHTGDPWAKTFLRRALRPLAPARVLEVRDQFRHRRQRPPDVRQLVSDVFLQGLGMKRHASWAPETTRLPALRASHRDLLQEISDDGFMDLVDAWSARAGLELRHPYTDRKLLEFCFALPGDQHFRDGWPRWIQRQGIRGLVPESIRWRVGKGRFGPDFHSRVLAADWDEVTRLAATGGSIERYVDMHRLRLAYRSAGPESPASTSCLLWALWVNRFVEFWNDAEGNVSWGSR